MTAQPGQRFDIIIIGGGLVGASLAVALAPTMRNVLVVEPAEPHSDQQPSYDERTVALTWSAKLVFSAMGVWEQIASLQAEPIRDIHVSNRGRFGQAHLSCRHAGTEALGYVVPTRTIGQVLWDSMHQQNGLTIACPAQATAIRQNEDDCSVDIETDNGQVQSRAPLVVLADGGRSALSDKLAFSARDETYNQTAVLSIVTTDRPHSGRAYERFTDHGPLALLPHSSVEGRHRYAVVWTTSNDQVASRMAMEDAEFIEALQYEFGDRAGNFSLPSARKCYPLSRSSLNNPVDRRVLAVGNAAHTVHPVAGQGFNLGLRDIAGLAESIFNTAESELGSPSMLDAYLSSRSDDAQRVDLFTHSLIQLFSNDLPPLSLARNLGLVAVEYLPPMKRFLLKRTMGLSANQPRMALGIPLDN